MPTNYRPQAKNLLMTDYFIFDIDFRVAKNEHLKLFQQTVKLSDINPSKDYKIDMYVNYRQLFKF